MSNRQTKSEGDAVGSADWLVGGGEMGDVVRSKDWSKTPLGPIDTWPQSLRTTVSLCLSSNFPISIAWGPECVQIYNDGYWPICAAKHPHSMGQDFRECWRSAWPAVGDAFERASKGETTFLENQRMFLDRLGYLEETFFTFSFSPIRDESGKVGGLFHPVTELTQQSLAERRLGVLRDLTDRPAGASSVSEGLALIAETLAGSALDVPFALLYRLEGDGRHAHILKQVGLPPTSDLAPDTVEVEGSDSLWPFSHAMITGRSFFVEDLIERAGRFECRPYNEPIRAAAIHALRLPGLDCPFGFLVTGVSSRRPLDAPYRTFYDMLGAAVNNALAKAQAYEQERARGEALVEIDRAKTAFFSNVSHEFRTPLTLMLGPIAELLESEGTGLSPSVSDRLRMVNRNGLRLLRLVNSLLEFSRIEAGRVEAVYTPIDLAALTSDLAGTFRSAIERAGLRLEVDCPPLPEPVYVDRDMWEKIVLNLLSNAFKFTFEGGIGVELRHVDRIAELRVRDSGVGIPSHAIPRLFERFYRVEGARGRSFEGSGIGLALVQELAHLHGGTVRVETLVGQGSTFVVALPFGKAHLPSERIDSSAEVASIARHASLFLEEAHQWLPDDSSAECSAHSTQHSELAQSRPRVLVADDNADMRQYLIRLLSDRYVVETVPDGEAALRAARDHRPDLILSDVMMPRLDGFALLRALREEDGLKIVPVILLSARAGEESCVEGMEKGADDYLIKPFGARELLARVQTHLELARVRREMQAVVEESEARFREMANHAPVMVWVSDPEGKGTFLSNSWYEFTGQTPQTGLGAGWLNAVHPDDRQRVDEEFQQANDRRASFRLDYRMRRYDGVYRWAIDCAAPRFDRSGEFLGYIGSVLDITDRKQTEEALRDSEARFAGFMRHLPGLAWIKDSEGRYLFVNEAASRAFPAVQGGVYGMTDFELFPPDTASQFRDNDLRALGTHSGTQVVETLRQDDGVHFSLVTKFAIPSVGGGGAMVGGMAIDITDQKRAEHAVRHSEERLRLAMETGKVGVWDWDMRSNAVSWTPSLYAIHGLTPDETEITFERFRELVHPEDRPRVSTAIQASVDRDMAYEMEFRAIRPDGEVIWLFTHAVVVKEGDVPVRMIGAAVDITQSKLTERDLLVWNTELERRVEARTGEVMATKNRLRALARELNLAEQRERKRLAGELHDYLAQMLVVTRMKLHQSSSLIPPGKAAVLIGEADDVLAQSLAYTRSLVAELVPPALYEFGLRPSLEWLMSKMREHGLTAALHWDAGRLTIPEDQAILLYQSVRELLFNVLKHSGTSAATVSVARADQELTITVADEGRGFLSSSVESGEKGRDRFGLFSIRERLLTMGGRLEIDSAAGRGTRVTLWAPCLQEPSRTDTPVRHLMPSVQGNGATSGVARPSVDHHHDDRIRVLLVDDHRMVREGLRSVLDGYADVQVVGEASDGAEAVIAVGALAPSVVVMDINMPKMNGIQATEQITAHHPNVVVIGLSVQTNQDAQTAMYQAGAVALLTKEAAVEQLYATIRQALHRDPDLPNFVSSSSSRASSRH